jgi:hypothetical protein
MPFDWEQSAFLGYMVEQWEKDQEEEEDEDNDEEYYYFR